MVVWEIQYLTLSWVVLMAQSHLSPVDPGAAVGGRGSVQSPGPGVLWAVPLGLCTSLPHLHKEANSSPHAGINSDYLDKAGSKEAGGKNKKTKKHTKCVVVVVTAVQVILQAYTHALLSSYGIWIRHLILWIKKLMLWRLVSYNPGQRPRLVALRLE